MSEMQADKLGKHQRVFEGRTVWMTNKVCDRCMDAIEDRVYYHCSAGCDVDFCLTCQKELDAVLHNFLKDDRGEKSSGNLMQRMKGLMSSGSGKDASCSSGSSSSSALLLER